MEARSVMKCFINPLFALSLKDHPRGKVILKVLESKDLTKWYGKEVLALNEVSFAVDEGDFFVIIGPSGCGKSTLLKVIAGLLDYESGQLFIKGTEVKQIPPHKRDISLMLENYALFPHMSVYDNIAFGLRMLAKDRSEIDKQVKESLKLVGMEGFERRSPLELSGGQRQRVALARAIVVNPSVLLLDEPLSNVAAKVRERMRGELKRIQKEIGIATVFVTHDQLEAMVLGDRIAVMKDGLIEQIAEPDEVYAHPHTLFVADFIGSPSMNLIECELLGKEERVFLDAQDFAIDITKFAETIKKKATGPELIMGIRPEDLSMSIKKIDPKAIRGEVQLIESLGSSSIYHIKVGEKPLLVKGLLEVEVGDKVWVRFDLKKLHLFDKKTKVALW